MASITKLEKMYEYFINGNTAKAEELFQSYLIESAAAYNQTLIEQDEIEKTMPGDQGQDLEDTITGHKREIRAEELYNEDEDEHQDSDEYVDHDQAPDENEFDKDDLELDFTSLSDTVKDLKLDHESLEDKFQDLEKEFEEIIKNQKHEDEPRSDRRKPPVRDDADYGDHDEHDGHDEHDEPGADHDQYDFSDEHDDAVEESIELMKFTADNADKTKKAKSPVSKTRDRDSWGGSPVKIHGKTNSNMNRVDVKVPELTKHTNHMGKGAILRSAKADNSDRTNGKVAPAMPKNKK